MPAVPPELMKLMAGGGGQKGPPMPAAQPQGGEGGPTGAPMSTPQPNHGERQTAYVNISLAGDLLEQAMPSIGSETEEGRALLDVLHKLSKTFGHTKSKSQELVPAELMQLMSALPQGGGATPVQKAMGQPGGMPGQPPHQGMPPQQMQQAA